LFRPLARKQDSLTEATFDFFGLRRWESASEFPLQAANFWSIKGATVHRRDRREDCESVLDKMPFAIHFGQDAQGEHAAPICSPCRGKPVVQFSQLVARQRLIRFQQYDGESGPMRNTEFRREREQLLHTRSHRGPFRSLVVYPGGVPE